jgi:3,4-dihydroxy 2-butanone 4-phosphate synthase/GTP cyclohydrolase II
VIAGILKPQILPLRDVINCDETTLVNVRTLPPSRVLKLAMQRLLQFSYLDPPLHDTYSTKDRRNIGCITGVRIEKGVELNETKNRATAVSTVRKEAEANLPTEFGPFRIVGFRSTTSNEEFVVLVKGEIEPHQSVLVRIHSQCLTGDVFHSLKCDCGSQFQRAMEMIQDEGRGLIVYQQQEGRGIGIINKIRAYALQDEGADTIEANLRLGFDVDHREYQQCAEIIRELGAHRVRLLSNNPEKFQALRDAGLEVVERVPIEVQAKAPAINYLITKKEKMGHLLLLNGIF